MEQPKLGELAPEGAFRDAIHVAIIPMVARERLLPGWCMKLNADGDLVTAAERDDPDVIGVVDPFLKASVAPEERFWLCLRPGMITSLRHVWSSPAFKVKVPEAKDG